MRAGPLRESAEGNLLLGLVIEPTPMSVRFDDELNVGADRQVVDTDTGRFEGAQLVKVNDGHVLRIVQVLGGVAVGQDAPAGVLRGEGGLAGQPLDVAGSFDNFPRDDGGAGAANVGGAPYCSSQWVSPCARRYLSMRSARACRSSNARTSSWKGLPQSTTVVKPGSGDAKTTS